MVWLAEPLIAGSDRPDVVPLKPGDSLLVDTKAAYAYERVPKAEQDARVAEVLEGKAGEALRCIRWRDCPALDLGEQLEKRRLVHESCEL